MYTKRAFTFLCSGTEWTFNCQMLSGFWLYPGTEIVEVNVCKEKVNVPIVEDQNA
jgi:hypothetical protein